MSTEQSAEVKPETQGWPAALPGRWLLIATGALWAFALVVYLAVYVLPSAAQIESLYSGTLFRLITGILIPITEKFPFSLSLLLTLLLIFGGPVLWGLRWVQLVRAGHGHLAGLAWAPFRLVFLLPLLFVWFAVFWGAGYQRPPVEKRWALATEKPTEAEVQGLLDQLLPIIVRDLPKADADRDVDRAVRAISDAMAEHIRYTENPLHVRLPRRVKATPPGFLLFNSTSGICSPFTLEANVDGAIPDTGFVYVAAHELAHTAGINREGEATLYGQIAGLRANDAYARYCIALDAYTDLARDLNKDARAAALKRLPEQSQAELAKIREIMSSYNVDWFSRYSWRVYDGYLKSQGIAEGTKNYSESTRLFVLAARKGLMELDASPERWATP